MGSYGLLVLIDKHDSREVFKITGSYLNNVQKGASIIFVLESGYPDRNTHYINTYSVGLSHTRHKKPTPDLTPGIIYKQ